MASPSSITDVLLSDQSTWDTWYETIKAAVPEPLWKYFDPDSEVVFPERITPAVPQLEPASETPALSSGSSTRSTQTPASETADQQAAREARYTKALDTHVKLLSIYRVAKKDWDNYHTTVTKLRGKIQGSVARQKAAKFRTELPVRTWLRDLRLESINCTGRRGHPTLHSGGVH